MIPQDFVDDLLAKTDIVDVIDQYVPLKKGGANYMACCPFHKEKSPSFSVSPSKQFYHCFGCGAHGSAIGFVMEHQGLGFVEAVQLLADRVGMSVPNVRRKIRRPPPSVPPKNSNSKHWNRWCRQPARFTSSNCRVRRRHGNM